MRRSFLALLGLAGLLVWGHAPSDAALFASNRYPTSCSPVVQTISKRQSAISADSDGVNRTTIGVTMGTGAGVGDAIFGIVTYDTSTGGTLTSITDDQGNAYTILDAKVDAPHTQNTASFYRLSLTNSPITITANFSASLSYSRIAVDDFINVLSVSALDGHASQALGTTGTGTDAATSGSITTTTAADGIWGGVMLIGGSPPSSIVHGTGFTTGADGDTGPNTRMMTEWKLQGSAGATAATFTLGYSQAPTVFVIAFKAAVSCSAPPPPPPPTASCYLGVFVGGFSPDQLAPFNTYLGRTADYAVVFGGNANASDFTGSTGYVFSQWPAGQKLLFSQPLIFSGGSLAAAASGAYDSYYASIAASIASGYDNGQIFAVRIGWEFNGDWYPWSIHSGSAADYVTAWRKLALAIRALRPAIKFDWNQNVQQMIPDAAYPGDDVVDYITMDMYENSAYASGDGPTRWASFVSQPDGFTSLTTFLAFATAHNKPMAFPEYASNINDGYFDHQVYLWTLAHRVAYQSYWNSTSAFNGLLSNFPVNQSTYLADWHTPAACGS